MAITYLNAAQISTDGTGNISGSFDPGATAHGIIVFVVQNGVAASEISGVTYGGQAMTLLRSASDTAGEPGRVEAWGLYGASLPSGSQTVAMTASASVSTKRVYCVAFSAGTGYFLQSYTTASDGNDQANPSDSQTIPSNLSVAGCACLFSGNTAANISVANGTQRAEANFSGGLAAASLLTAAEVSGASLTMGWTVASDDVAAVYVYIIEAKHATGTVTLSGVAQQSASIYFLWPVGAGPLDLQETLTSDVSGVWTTTNPVWKGSSVKAFCDYDSGSNKYTALSHAFVTA